MRKTVLYIGGVILISSLSGACVSKKKYEDLAKAKRAVDRNLLETKQQKDRHRISLCQLNIKEGIREKLECMKKLCEERNSLYEKQNELKWRREKLERSFVR